MTGHAYVILMTMAFCFRGLCSMEKPRHIEVRVPTKYDRTGPRRAGVCVPLRQVSGALHRTQDQSALNRNTALIGLSAVINLSVCLRP